MQEKEEKQIKKSNEDFKERNIILSLVLMMALTSFFLFMYGWLYEDSRAKGVAYIFAELGAVCIVIPLLKWKIRTGYGMEIAKGITSFMVSVTTAVFIWFMFGNDLLGKELFRTVLVLGFVYSLYPWFKRQVMEWCKELEEGLDEEE